MKISSAVLALSACLSLPALADSYQFDMKGAHAFVNFKIKHLGYSWLHGRFDQFDGSFDYDEKTQTLSNVVATIDTTSVNTNHTKRDRHLKSDDFLSVDDYPKATFKSTGYQKTGEKTGTLTGDLTLRGVTKSIDIPVEHIGGGKDPWGGYRHGFSGGVELKLKDYNIKKDLGPASQTVHMILDIEGIRQ